MKVPPQLIVFGVVGAAYAAYRVRLKCMSNIVLCGRYMKVTARINKKRFGAGIVESWQYTLMRNECIDRGLI